MFSFIQSVIHMVKDAIIETSENNSLAIIFKCYLAFKNCVWLIILEQWAYMALKFCFETYVAMKFVDDDDDHDAYHPLAILSCL